MPARTTIHAVAGFAKAMLRFGCRDVQLNGLDAFLRVLQDQQRLKAGRGILTYCNHISVMDEPTVWGAMPWSTFRDAATTRWTLGASDIMFTNKTLARFFESGQVIETHRGAGIFQPALDRAVSKLESAQWVHLFPEGFVNVTRTTALRRFKWGITRLLLEPRPQMPLVVPMWITGFDRIMPEPRGFPRFLPRLGARVSISFGDPLDLDTRLSPLVDAVRAGQTDIPASLLPADVAPSSECSLASPGPQTLPSSLSARAAAQETLAMSRARSLLAEVLRVEMRNLARRTRAANGLDPNRESELCHTAMLPQEGSRRLDTRQSQEGKKDSAT